jgi:tRNA A64-2'-O-ribosylphosphate transferase
MPDALSKTIPIWCSVLNRLLFPKESLSHELHTPPQVVSQSEDAQISALLPSFLDSFRDLDLPIDHLRSQISKPLRPIWITPDSNLIPSKQVFDDFHPIICCTVSRMVAGGEVSEGGYIQGAGDDTENWAHGLTPSVFWANREALLAISEIYLPGLIEMLVSQAATSAQATRGEMMCLKPTSCLYISSIPSMTPQVGMPYTCTVVLLPKVTEESTWRTNPTRVDIGLGPHKLGSRNLRIALPFITDFVRNTLSRASSEPETEKAKHIIVACETGKDLSIGAALALLCLLFGENGDLIGSQDKPTLKIDKTFIRRRLGWISTSMPDANPSRATLQSVNSFLMERPR